MSFMIGYGITVRVDRGHLLVEDGIGADRIHNHQIEVAMPA